MNIRMDDVSGPEIRALLEDHLCKMRQISVQKSVHALDLEALRQPSVTVWSAWSGTELAGCSALKELDPAHGEIKLLRVAKRHRRGGAARSILQHVLSEARARAYLRLSLEIGAQPEFLPARRLYESLRFTYCGPFAEYTEDPGSVFMTSRISSSITLPT